MERPFEAVARKLVSDTEHIFQTATSTIEQPESEQIIADLHTEVGGVKVHREIKITILSKTEYQNDNVPVSIDLKWNSVEVAYLFPTMKGSLTARRIGNQTQLDFLGDYEPPFGVLGQTIDTMMGASVAEDCVEQFVSDVIDRLHELIPSSKVEAI